MRALRSSLPAELAEHLRAGDAPAEHAALPRFATRIGAVDALLGGGFPRGRVSEITGPPSSGRTSLVLALLAAATRDGETTAVVDAADAFDPASARAAGVDLGRVLWARPPRPHA
ncbi:MAG: recombinase RecA, partial [Proteobacteria bacterium]